MPRIADRHLMNRETIDWGREVRVGQIVAFRDVDPHEPLVRERLNIRGSEVPSPKSMFSWICNVLMPRKKIPTEGYIQVQVLDPGEKNVSNFVKIANDLERYREDLEQHSIREAKLNKKLDEKFNKLIKTVKRNK